MKVARGGMIMTRREMLLGVLLTLSVSLAVASPEKKPLEVTYYYLPG
jgi:hypothetical protein